MSRAKLVMKPEDYTGGNDAITRDDVDALFDHFARNGGPRAIPDTGKIFGVVARDPKLALLLVKVSDYMTTEFPFTTQRNDLRQLLIQTLNYHFKCDYSFQSHIAAANRNGITTAMQAAIPYWQITNVFDEEQKLVIEYTLAAVTGNVPDELFQRAAAQFGELGVVELSTAVAWWSLWAIIGNALLPQHDFGHRNAAA